MSASEHLEFILDIVDQRIFLVEFLNALDINLMVVFNLLICRVLQLRQKNRLPYNSIDFLIHIWEYAIFRPENNSNHLEFIQEQSQPCESIQCVVYFVLAKDEHWPDLVPVSHGVFDESFSLLDKDSVFFRSCERCFFESSWQESDIAMFFHGCFEAIGIHRDHTRHLEEHAHDGSCSN